MEAVLQHKNTIRIILFKISVRQSETDLPKPTEQLQIKNPLQPNKATLSALTQTQFQRATYKER